MNASTLVDSNDINIQNNTFKFIKSINQSDNTNNPNDSNTEIPKINKIQSTTEKTADEMSDSEEESDERFSPIIYSKEGSLIRYQRPWLMNDTTWVFSLGAGTNQFNIYSKNFTMEGDPSLNVPPGIYERIKLTDDYKIIHNITGENILPYIRTLIYNNFDKNISRPQNNLQLVVSTFSNPNTDYTNSSSYNKLYLDYPKLVQDYVNETYNLVKEGNAVSSSGRYKDTNLTYQFFLYKSDESLNDYTYFDAIGFQLFANINVSKVWNDTNHTQVRPKNVTIGLYADGKNIRNLTLDNDNGWKGNFSNLPIYNIHNTDNPMKLEDYMMNSKLENLVDIKLNKSSTVTMYYNITANGKVILGKIKNTHYKTFIAMTNQPKYDSDGNEIKYEVIEVTSYGTKKATTRLTLTTIDVNATNLTVQVVKKSDDEIMHVGLFRKGTVLFNTTLSKDNNWTFSTLRRNDTDTNYGLIKFNLMNITEYTIKEFNVSDDYSQDINITNENFDILHNTFRTLELKNDSLVFDENLSSIPNNVVITNSYLNRPKIWDNIGLKYVTREDSVVSNGTYSTMSNWYKYNIYYYWDSYGLPFLMNDTTWAYCIEPSNQAQPNGKRNQNLPPAILKRLTLTDEKIIHPVTGEDILPYLRTVLYYHFNDTENFTVQSAGKPQIGWLLSAFTKGYNYTDPNNTASKERFKPDGPQRIDFVNEIIDLIKSGKGINNTGSFYDSDYLTYQFYIYYTETDNIEDHYQNSIGFNIFTKINVTKQWNDTLNENKRPVNVTLDLKADNVTISTFTLNSSNNWAANFTNLSVYKIYNEELKEPDFSVVTTTDDALNFTVKVTWENGTPTTNRVIVYPIKGQMYLNPYIYLTQENNWTDSRVLPKNYLNGSEITNYIFKTNAANATLIVSNVTLNNAITNIKVTLNNESLQEDGVTVAITQDGTEFAGVRLNSNNKEYTFSELETYDEDGNVIDYDFVMRKSNYVNVINYTFSEPEVPEGYTVKLINSSEEINPFMVTKEQNSEKYLKELIDPVNKLLTNCTIINSYELTDLNITKKWNDINNKDKIRPDYILVHVYSKDNNYDETIVLNENNSWTKTIKYLQKYGENSTLINYIVEEVNVPDDYNVTITNKSMNYTITNTHIPKSFNLKINKIWNDSQNICESRPDKLQVNIFANGELYDTIYLNEENNWTYNASLPEYIDGKIVNYTVKEVVPDKYNASYNISIQNKTLSKSNIHVELLEVYNDTGFYKIIVTDDFGEIVTEGKIIVYNKEGNIYHEQELNNGFVSITWPISEDFIVNIEYPENEHYYGNTVTVTEDDLFYYDNENYTEINPYLMNDGNYGYCLNWSSHRGPDEILGYDDGKAVLMPYVKILLTNETFINPLTGEDVLPYIRTLLINHGHDGTNFTLKTDGNPVGIAQIIWIFLGQYRYGKYNYLDHSNFDDLDGDFGTTGKLISSIINETIHQVKSGNSYGNNGILNYTEDGIWTYQFYEYIPYFTVAHITFPYKFQGLLAVNYTLVPNEIPYNVNITNTYIPENVTVNVTKIWDDKKNQDGLRTNVTVGLYANGKLINKVILNDSNNWTHVFTNYTVNVTVVDDDGNEKVVEKTFNLYKYLNGSEIKYQFKELDIPDGYNVSYNVIVKDNDYYVNITNTHTPELINVTVNKVWNDNDNQDGLRPTGNQADLLIIYLYKNNKYFRTAPLSDSNNWTYTFLNVPKYEKGSLINYTVAEKIQKLVKTPYYLYPIHKNLTNYTAEIIQKGDNFTIINTHIPALTNVSVIKVWNDSDDVDGLRPKSISIILNANGEKYQSVVLNSENDWKYEFDNLPAYKDGVKIRYTVEEINIPEGYQFGVSINDYNITITNTHIQENITINVTKIWDDNNDTDGFRPENIIIELLANGVVNQTVKLNSSTNWTYSFTNLTVYKDGKKVNYTINEKVPEGYDVTYGEIHPVKVDTKISLELLNITRIDDLSGFARFIVIVKDQYNEYVSKGSIIVSDSEGNLITESQLDNGVKYIEVPVKFVAEKSPYGTNITIPGMEFDVIVKYEDNDLYSESTAILTDITDKLVVAVVDKNASDDGPSLPRAPWKFSDGNWVYCADPSIPDYEDTDINDPDQWIDNYPVPYIKVELNNETIINGYVPYDKYGVPFDEKSLEYYKVLLYYFAEELDEDGSHSYAGIQEIMQILTGYWTRVDHDFYNGSYYYEGEYRLNNTIYALPDLITKSGKPLSYYVNKTMELVESGIRIPNHGVRNTTVDGRWEYQFNIYYPYQSYFGENTYQRTFGIEYTFISGQHDLVTNLTNTHIVENITINVTKIWNDTENNDGIRPENITIGLFDGDKLVANVTLNESTGWNYLFKDLPKYRNATEIVYTVDEIRFTNKTETDKNITVIIPERFPPEGYSRSFDYCCKKNTTVIINTHIPENTTISVTKVWDDKDNQDGLRPGYVTVLLYAEGKNIKNVTLTNVTNWSYVFENLPKYNNAELIKYTVEELVIDGYTKNITSKNSTYFTITNTHIPENITINVTKVWDDQDNQDGKRPSSIQVRLFADNVNVKNLTISSSNDWKGSFNNLPKYNNSKLIEYSIVEGYFNNKDYYSIEITNEGYEFTITNTHIPEHVNITINKFWDDKDNLDAIRPDSITVNLYANGGKYRSVNLTAENNWTYTFTNLQKYIQGHRIIYSIDEVDVDGYESSIFGFNITNTHVPVLTNITINKIWNDSNNTDGKRPDKVWICLYSNGNEYTYIELNESNNWTYKFENLPVNYNGTKIRYDVSEIIVPEGYNVSIEKIDDNSAARNIVSRNRIKLLGNNPSVNINYPVHDQLISTVVDWDIMYTYCPMLFNDSSRAYCRDESGYPPLANGWNYTRTLVTDDSVLVNPFTKENILPYLTTFIITHYYDNTNLSNVWSSWGDGKQNVVWMITSCNYINKTSRYGRYDSRFDAVINEEGTKLGDFVYESINLVQNGNAVAYKGILKEVPGGYYVYQFYLIDALAKNNNNRTNQPGIQLLVDFVPKNYTKEVIFNITNTHIPEVTQINVTKVWKDNSNQDGVRPANVTINLYADGEEYTSVVLDSSNSWKYTFNNLPKYSDGHVIVYTLSEDSVANYTSTSVFCNGTYKFINTHVPELTNITVNKVWVDDDNRDGIRPSVVTVYVYANGVKVQTITLTSKDNWTTVVSNLPKYSNGKEIKYTVKEAGINGYYTSVDGLTITNTHIPEVTQINVTKVWNDSSNPDGVRPANVTITLYANGIKNMTIQLNSSKWSYTFSGLTKYENGVEIVYTVTEDHVDGYTSKLVNCNGTFKFINTHTPETVDVNVSKVWIDNNNRDNVRPKSIGVQLYADGKKLNSPLTLYDGNNWTAVFTNLPKYDNGHEIIYTVDEVALSEYYTKDVSLVNGTFIIKNTHIRINTTVTVVKVWNDNNNKDGKRTGNITVILYADGTKYDQVVLTEATNWTYTFTGLPAYNNGKAVNYTVDELTVPEGYTKTIKYCDYVYKIINTHKAELTSLTVTKQWNDDNNRDGIRPDTVVVELLADGKTYSIIRLDASNNWKSVISNLPKYDNGRKIVYTLNELIIPAGYNQTINGANIINTHDIELINLTVNKVWDDHDNNDGIRPENITVNLLENGKIIRSVTLNSKNNYTFTFKNLAKYYEGKAVNYTVQEKSVPKGYTQTIKRCGTTYTITNTHIPELTGITVNKFWNDDNNRDGIRPSSVSVNVYAKNKLVQTITLTGKDGWTYILNNLPKYDNGELIVYKVTENSIVGYTTSISGYNITNTHNITVTSIKVSKVWDDNDNRDGIRSDNITVKIYADKKFVREIVLGQNNNWTYTFKNLPAYKNGKTIKYTVDEETVPTGYTKTVKECGSCIKIINTHKPILTNITVKKLWDDDNNNDGLRPSNITVYVYKNSKKLRNIILNDDNKWTFTLKNLPKYENGKTVKYTIKESEIASYTTAINGYTITNTHKTTRTNITVKKVWADNADNDGIRPENITVQLYANNKPVNNPILLTTNNNWTYIYNLLPEYKNGKKVTYTIREINIPHGYTSHITNKTNDYIIINTHNKSNINLKINKIWNDTENKYNQRPKNITVKIYKNNEYYTNTTLTDTNNWTVSLTMNEYENGIKNTYTIKEANVKNYTTQITSTNNTYTITNTFIQPRKIFLWGWKLIGIKWEHQENGSYNNTDDNNINQHNVKKSPAKTYNLKYTGTYKQYNKYYNNKHTKWNKYSTWNKNRKHGSWKHMIHGQKYRLYIYLYNQYLYGNMSYADFVAILKENGITISQNTNWDSNGVISIDYDEIEDVPDSIELKDNGGHVPTSNDKVEKNNDPSSSGVIDEGQVSVDVE